MAVTIKSICPSSDWGDRFVVEGEGLTSEVNASSLIRALAYPDDGVGHFQRKCFFASDPTHTWETIRSERDSAYDDDIGRGRGEEIQRLSGIDVAILQSDRHDSAGGVVIGMSKAKVLQTSWGQPLHVNTTITAGKTREQWVYGQGSYLYFDNGILTTIQK